MPFHGNFYYVNRGDNCDNCTIKNLQEIIQFGRFITVLTKKTQVIYQHTYYAIKQNIFFLLSNPFTLQWHGANEQMHGFSPS